MSDTSDSETRVYPTASVVVGVGRVGLAVLERLGERWAELRTASEDPSLSNLRLLHVRPDDDGRGERWRQHEREYVRIARYTGDDDLPSRALDFAILRSLGVVRFRDGAYQVGLPRDRGVVDEAHDGSTARRRFFEWTHLSPDPLGAAERLSELDEEIPELSRFIVPLLNRVKLGHSPETILALVSRCRALSEGRDPSPWSWLSDQLAVPRDNGVPEAHRELPVDREWLEPGDRNGVLDNYAAEPLEGWSRWRDARGGDPPELSIVVPAPFVPQTTDLSAPVAPTQFLEGDWERTGWATDPQERGRHAHFPPAESSPFRLGLFDHDDSSEALRSRQKQFSERLEKLGTHAHRGLVRLWVDLQRNRVDEGAGVDGNPRRRGESSDSLRQSLELLGELVVRPIADHETDEDELEALELAERADARMEEGEFRLDPSERLTDLTLDHDEALNEAARALRERLDALGFASEADPLPERRLFRQVEWTPEDAHSKAWSDSVDVDPDLDQRGRPGALEFRSMVNEEVRNLFQFDRLREIRDEPSGRPPRLNVYVVADMGEPFSRTVTRSVLQCIHAEIQRAYGPLFETYREGFNRTLAIHPILWTPHPADAFGGRYPVENRCEEASIIESVQGVRRWVESIPDETCCIPQIFLNSHVTDKAVLGPRQAVEETYDFLSFRVRNRFGDDPWLRRVATGSEGGDLFATFSCNQIEFPAHTAREYLANRLARDSLRELVAGDDEAPTFARESLDPPDPDDIEADGRADIRSQTRSEAEACASDVEQRLGVDFWTTSETIRSRFDGAYERELIGNIHDRWRRLTRQQGRMDEVVDALRRRSADRIGELVEHVREVGDELIQEYASRGDLGAAKAGFNDLDRIGRDWLREAERERRRGEQDCLDHDEPSMDAVERARSAVSDEAPAKPRGRAMAVGLVAWLLLAPAIGAPLAWSLSQYLDLPSDPGVAEFFLGPVGYVTGGLVVFAIGGYLAWSHMQTIVDRIRESIDDLAETVRQVVHGSGEGLDEATSIRTFVEARFGHAGRLELRNHARRVYESIARDDALARRIFESIDIQRRRLARRAERLGVHADKGDAGAEEDDLSDLFSGGVLRDRRSLLPPEELLDYYRSRVGDRLQIRRALPEFIERTGGFSNWRQTAVMADDRQLTNYGRDLFAELVEHPIAEQPAFGESAGDRLVAFVADVFPHMGFGAKFTGFEGIDPDGIDILAETAILMHPKLRGIYDRARLRNDIEAETETLDVLEIDIDPNSAFMLSLATGIRPHSIRNLGRHESFAGRSKLPDDRAFPLSGEPPPAGPSTPVNHLTGHDELRETLNASILRRSEVRTDHSDDVPTGAEAAREAAARSTEATTSGENADRSDAEGGDDVG